MRDLIEDHWLTIVAGIAGIAIITHQAPAFMAKQRANAANNDIATAQNLVNSKLNTEALKRSERQTIANTRYEKGCEVVTELRNPKTAATIRDKEPIVIGSRADEFAKLRAKGAQFKQLTPFFWNVEQVFCDFYGVTAVTRYDASKGYYVAADIATTTDQQVIGKVRAQYPAIFRPNVTKGN